MQRRVAWFVVGMLSSVLVPAIVRAEPTIVLPRPGQVGVGLQGQYGSLSKSGDLGELFGNGPGIAVRLRYRMRYERAIGLSFESHQLDARSTAGTADTSASQITMIMSGFDIYQLFGTRTRTTKMLSVGLGLMQPSVKLNDGETTFPDDGIYLSAGAGLERFFYHSLAFDLSTRYFAIFQHGQTTHDVQASLGIIFYASY